MYLWILFVITIILAFVLVTDTPEKNRTFLTTINDNIKKNTPYLRFLCINLPSDSLRRSHIKKVFGDYIQFVDAVDTRGNSWYMYKDYLSNDALYDLEWSLLEEKRIKHSELSPGGIGCFLSHVKCWNIFIKTPDPIVFILEDDTICLNGFTTTLNKLYKHLPKDTDVVLFSFNSTYYSDEPLLVNGIKLYKMSNKDTFYYTNAYLLTKQGAHKLLQEYSNTLITMQIDAYMSDMIHKNKLVVYRLETNICPQSSINGSHVQTIPI